jgi:hypothetical protein
VALPADGGAPAQSNASETDVKEALDRAKEIRRQFIQQFGTDEEKRGLQNPNGATGMYSISMRPQDIFGRVFVRSFAKTAGAPQLAQPPTGNKAGSVAKRAVFAGIWGFVNQLATYVPNLSDGLTIATSKGLDRGTIGGDIKARDAMARTLTSLAGGMVKMLLSGEDQAAYADAVAKGDYQTQTAYCFKAEAALLKRQDFPSPFVIWLCDVSGGTEARQELAPLFPGDERFQPATWSSYDLSTMWKTVTAALQELFRQGGSDLLDDAKAGKFLERFPSTSDLSDDDLLINAFGTDALKAPRENKRRMRAVAAARASALGIIGFTLTGAQTNGSAE